MTSSAPQLKTDLTRPQGDEKQLSKVNLGGGGCRAVEGKHQEQLVS